MATKRVSPIKLIIVIILILGLIYTLAIPFLGGGLTSQFSSIMTKGVLRV
ncbi:MAG: hypothetical protein HY459_03105 [Parcubacteria group bacterium]|nr:hypothetical protein [Parcubacteria group bacterium]